MEFEQYKTDRELITKEVHIYTFLTNIKITGVKYYRQDETTSRSAFAEEVNLLCE